MSTLSHVLSDATTPEGTHMTPNPEIATQRPERASVTAIRSMGWPDAEIIAEWVQHEFGYPHPVAVATLERLRVALGRPLPPPERGTHESELRVIVAPTYDPTNPERQDMIGYFAAERWSRGEA